MISCREYQPLLGMGALGKLTGPEWTALQAHLDGCPMCRVELGELSDVASALAQADPDRVRSRPEPPPWLRDNIFEQIVAPPKKRSRHRVRRFALAGAGVAMAASLAGFLFTGPLAAEDPPGRTQRPTVSYASGNVRADATLTPQSYGSTLNLSVSGLNEGQQYMVWLEWPNGKRMPAGSFVAHGSQRLDMELSTGMQVENAAALGLSAGPGGPAILRAPISR